ncbi:unnamed protein product [Candidula unifasciata]|uniref:receptor protein-tyrosine kinase n=1 Tax=Candidula unifasciata TaxID=100452 RepID=A0A8S4A4X5_9EUPU|nr:unnamed protein product [Candidula unifasciata]
MNRRLILLLLVVAVLGVQGNKKSQNNRIGLDWNPSSMPAMNTRLVSFNSGKGKELNLDCRVKAHPKASIAWFKDGAQIQESDSIEMKKKFNLVLKSLSSDMNGNYTCVVSNKHGQLDWTFHVDVPVKIWPLEIQGPQNITQPRGSSATFTCMVLNDPNATIRWQKVFKMKTMDDNGPLPAFLPVSGNPHLLTLNNIQAEDEGEYRCMAGNVWGLRYISAWLTVQEPPGLSNKLNPDEKNYNGNDIVYDTDVNEYESMDSHESAGPYITTKRPKNKGNRKKHGKKKDRKNKEKNQLELSSPLSQTVTTWTTSPIIATEDMYKTTTPEIWPLEHEKNMEDIDTRNTMIEEDHMEDAENTDVAKPAEDEQLKGSISSWTIYTIVGAIGGVVLLIGLLAITLTVCLKKDEGGIYKSSNV